MKDHNLYPLRTLLFVPGNKDQRVKKAADLGADGVIIDLEDAVPLDLKLKAREWVREGLSHYEGKKVCVRINSLITNLAQDDLEAVICPHLCGIMLPKVESPEDILTVEKWISQIEKSKNIPHGYIEILPLIESAKGIEQAKEIAQSHFRVHTLTFGGGDFCADLGITLTEDQMEFLYARSRLAIACRIAEIEPPIDTPFFNLDNEEGLIHEAHLAKRLGFQGKLIIHPKQIDPVHSVFTPSSKEVEEAKRILEVFKEAEAKGEVAISLDGKFIDYAFLRKAKRTISLAEKIR